MQENLSKKKKVLGFLGIAILFVLLHLPGLNQPYHQDEYKWPVIVNPALTEPGGIPHPPVGEFIYRQAGFLVGYDNFRLAPFFFGFLNLILIFFLARIISGSKAALWTAGLFTLSFYSLLASLMVDTDGAIMPFFFLLSSIFYYKWKEVNFNFKSKWFWFGAISAAFGFLVKVSFAIGIAALLLDFIFEKGVFKDKQKFAKYSLSLLGVAALLMLLLFLSKFIFPFFNLEGSLKYWEHFANFKNRGWGQTFIQFIKACFYLSPFLVLAPFLSDKDAFRKLRPFFFFIAIGLFFYLFAFDFSTGALDRYLQFLVVPLCLITASLLSDNINRNTGFKNLIPAITISALIFFVQFFYQYVPSLHPKSAWVGRILSFKWNFLYPFSGGSGPLGFYISFAFIALFWIFGALLILSFFRKKDLKPFVLSALLVVGIFYNSVFIEEYLFGKINGYTPDLVRESSEFIASDPDIQKVVVYNDNGGYEVIKTGKYEKRLYTAPYFDQSQKMETINSFSGHYLEIDVPPIDPKSFYRGYLDSCKIIYEKSDKQMHAKIYDCRNAPKIKNI